MRFVQKISSSKRLLLYYRLNIVHLESPQDFPMINMKEFLLHLPVCPNGMKQPLNVNVSRINQGQNLNYAG